MLAVLALVGCSSHKARHDGRERLDSAIALYIRGEYSRAVEAFLGLTGELAGDEDVRTAYLYLGRSYMALGDYVKAADAFSSGRLLGGGVVFDQYLATAQQHLRSVPRITRTQPAVTRGELSALIDNYFGDVLAETPQADSGAGDHWAEVYASRVASAGVMKPLADGSFHADAPVTYPALYVVLLRLARVTGMGEDAIAAYFPQGFRGALVAAATSPAGGGVARPSGGEVTEILETLRDLLAKDERAK